MSTAYTKYLVNNVCKLQLCRDRAGGNAKISLHVSQQQASASDGTQHDQHLLLKAAALHRVTSELHVASVSGIRESKQDLKVLDFLHFPIPSLCFCGGV